MPRGKRKLGAWDCTIWFKDGARYRVSSIPGRVFSAAEALASIEKDLIPMLKHAVSSEARKAAKAAGAVDPAEGSDHGLTPRESKSSTSEHS